MIYKYRKKLAFIWAIVIVSLALSLTYQFQTGLKIKTSILDLLPNSQENAVIEKAHETYTGFLSRKMVFLISAPNIKQAIESADLFATVLTKNSNVFDTVFCKTDADLNKAYYDFFFDNRFQILSKPNQKLLTDIDGHNKLIQKAREILYSPMAGLATAQIESDPLFLFYDLMKNLPLNLGNFSIEDNHFVLKKDNQFYVMVSAVSKDDVFKQQIQNEIIDQISLAKAAIANNSKNTNLIWTGMIKYGHDAVKTAKSEISIIGTGSTIGIIILMLFAFGSLRQLMMGVLPIAVGILAAFSTCALVFNDLHIITLVFGASLIGVCIDYSFHYLAAQFAVNCQYKKSDVLPHVFKGITLGMITSVIGYMCILIAPFSGLRQMALFSSVGLIAAYATVIFWFPLFNLKSSKNKKPFLLKISNLYLNLFSKLELRKSLLITMALLFLILCVSAFSLNINDDINLLRSHNKTLRAEENKIAGLTDSFDKSRFILVEGKTPQAVLNNEELLLKRLDFLVKQKSINGYHAISKLLPSVKHQQNNASNMANVFKSSTFASYMQELGFESQYPNELLDSLKKQKPMTILDLQNTPIFTPISHLWLGKTARGYASIIMIDTVHNSSDLYALNGQFKFATYVDKISEISKLFSDYRVFSSVFALGGYVIIFALMLWLYGLKQGAKIILPPAITAITILGVMGLFNITANLFTFLALLLILGISIDYTIFFTESNGQNTKTAFAIFLSAITTILSFGLLALSSTPVLSTFGLTVLIGIAIATFLSPVCRSKHVLKNQNENN